MTKSTSAYCDLLRIFAAATVFFAHLSWHRLSGGMLYWLQPYGHAAVIIFFVLSGYVIGYVAHERERTLKDYTAARLSRLYSVVLPAIFLTFALDAVGMMIHPEVYPLKQENLAALRMLLAAGFLNQSWFGDWALLSNGAFWSLPYEFWYYAMFGAIFYLEGKLRWMAAAVFALIAGPDILLYFPLWLFGLAAYLLSRRKIAAPRWLFAATAVIALAVFAKQGTFVHFHVPRKYLPEEFRVEDFFLGLAVAGNLLAASQLELPLRRAQRWISRAAGVTFSLYLFHLPLLYFCAAAEPASWSPYLRGGVMLAVVPPVVWALSQITEARKSSLRRHILSLLDRVAGLRPILGQPVSVTPRSNL